MLYFIFEIQTRFSYHGLITTKSCTEPDFLTTVHYNGKATFQFLLCFPYEGGTRFPYHSFITKTFQNNVRNHKILPLFPYKVTRNCYARQYLSITNFPLIPKLALQNMGQRPLASRWVRWSLQCINNIKIQYDDILSKQSTLLKFNKLTTLCFDYKTTQTILQKSLIMFVEMVFQCYFYRFTIEIHRGIK